MIVSTASIESNVKIEIWNYQGYDGVNRIGKTSILETSRHQDTIFDKFTRNSHHLVAKPF